MFKGNLVLKWILGSNSAFLLRGQSKKLGNKGDIGHSSR